jgi:hypothetical protein
VPVRAPFGAGDIVKRWRDRSAAGGWRHGDEWFTPAVYALAESLAGEDVDPIATATRLGNERAEAGIGLRASLTDLAAGLDLIGTPRRVRDEMADALAQGWADAVADWFDRTPFGCIDVLTDLVTRDYLSVRLREIYAEAAARGETAADSRTLMVLSLRRGAAPLLAERRMFTAARILANVFGSGETLARVGRTCAVAVVRRGSSLNDQLLAVQLELSFNGLAAAPTHARLWLEALPGEPELLPELLDELASG